MKRKMGWMVGAMVMGLAGLAFADVFWTSGAGHFVGLSGFSGTFLAVPIGQNETLAKAATQFGVSGIGIREAWDKPCEAFIFGREFGTHPASDLVLGRNDIGCSSATITLHTVNIGTDRYIRALQACNNHNSNHRLKGLKIFSVMIQADGTMTEEPNFDVYEQTNCDDWGDIVSCPSGEVATGVRMNVDGDAFVGIELKCAPVNHD